MNKPLRRGAEVEELGHDKMTTGTESVECRVSTAASITPSTFQNNISHCPVSTDWTDIRLTRFVPKVGQIMSPQIAPKCTEI